MAGEEKFGYFGLGEGTEEVDGSLSSGCGWLDVLCVWRWELVTDCFVCEKSGKVVSCYRSGGGGGQRRELNVLKRLRMSGALLILLWKCEDLAVWTSVEKDESNDWYLVRSNGSFDLCHFLSAALSLVRCSWRTSDNQGLEGAARAGLEERGQMSSRQEVKVEHKVSVAAFTSRDVKWVGEGKEEDTTEKRREGERERRLRLKVTGKGDGGTRVAKCKVNVMKKWSEICSGCTRMLSVVQLRV